jgi:hypothetical protein
MMERRYRGPGGETYLLSEILVVCAMFLSGVLSAQSPRRVVLNLFLRTTWLL